MMKTGHASDGPNAAAGEPPKGRNLFGSILRLVPYSGVQFIDLEVATDKLSLVRSCFVEERLTDVYGPRTVLLPLEREHQEDEVVWHPMSLRPLRPEETLTIDGYEALEPFLNTWLPLPYLRYLGRHDDGRPRYDVGPSNWARVYVAAPKGGLRGGGKVKIVVAYDTRLERTSRVEGPSYHSPTVEDALFGSTFVAIEDPLDLGEFLGEDWVDVWLSDAFGSWREMRQDAEAASSGRPSFELEFLARYLTFLRVLCRMAGLPQVRFSDSVSKTLPVTTVSVDLVLDIGAAETSAILVAGRQGKQVSELGSSSLLRLRDLARPDVVYQGSFPTSVEFDQQTFGNPMASRMSGRSDAFLWPSFVRVGHEARRHALRANATEGVTGLSVVKAHLNERAPCSGVWRFSTDNASGHRHGPMVAGSALSHLSEDGTLLLTGPAGSSGRQVPAVRPRFSRSSMLSFFAAEVLLHALSQINAPSPSARDTAPSEIWELQRIIIPTPMAMLDDERTTLLARVQAGIDLVWRSYGWDKGSVPGAPARPEVVFGLGADIGAQLIYLFDEIKTRFGGSFTEFVSTLKSGTSAQGEAARELRVASLELTSRTTALTIIDYQVSESGVVQPELKVTERSQFGGDKIVHGLIHAHVLPAIEADLLARGLVSPKIFLEEVIGRSATSLLVEDPYFASRLNRKVLWPAAQALLRLHEEGAPRIMSGGRSVTLGSLVSYGGGCLVPLDEQLDAAAQRAGARDFHIGDVKIPLRRRQLAATVRSELLDPLMQACEIVRAKECDLLLLSGKFAMLPDVMELLLTLLPMPASRIVRFQDRELEMLRRPNGAEQLVNPAALVGAVSSYLASRNLLRSDDFNLATSRLVVGAGREDGDDGAVGGGGMTPSDAGAAQAGVGGLRGGASRPSRAEIEA